MRAALVCVVILAAVPAAAQNYRFPLQMPSGTQPYITAHRDNDSGGALSDYGCGDNTYNNHKGTDIGIGGFPVMDDGSRVVVAAAAGTVVAAVDGCFDRCTSGTCNCGDGFGNYVRVDHADGKRTYYGHLQNGSVLVNDGDAVDCGTPLGRVGSSGFSTGPHLHFEVRHDNNASDDPFAGACGGPTSYWTAQAGYNELPDDVCEGGSPPPPPDTGVVHGAAFEDVGAGTADMGIRLAGASIFVAGTALSTTATGDDALWTFDNAPAGTVTIRASAPGYVDAERSCDVAGGGETWCSIGLVRAAAPGEAGEGEGEAGEGEGEAGEGEGEADEGEGEGEAGEGEGEAAATDVERVTILPAEPSANGTCANAGAGAPLLVALGAAARRRRRRA